MNENSAKISSPGWKQFVGSKVQATARLLTWLGENTGIEWLIYNPIVQYGFERAAMRNAPIVCSSIHELFPEVKSVLDVGCASGWYAAKFKSLGLDVIGVEYSAKLRGKAARRGVTVYPFNVSIPTHPPPERPFDLAMSLEVAEHVPPQFADMFTGYFKGLCKRIVFTAAHPGQRGTSHINEQPREYWIEKFKRNGFDLDEQSTHDLAEVWTQRGAHWYLPKNLSVFVARSGRTGLHPE